MLIPEGFGQANFFFTGLPLPLGAQVTVGLEMPLPTPEPEDTAEVFYNAWASNVCPFQIDGVTLSKVLVKYGPNETGVFAEFSGTDGGGDAGDPEAPSVSVLVKKITVAGGRAGRGRLFMPGIRETRVQEGGNIVGTYRDDLQAGFDAFQAEIEGADYNLMVLHGENSPLEDPSQILRFSVDSRAATQRRRLRH